MVFNQIKQQLTDLGMTQQEVSKSLKLHDAYLWKSIKNNSIRLHTLQDVCKVVGLEVKIVKR